MRSQKLLRRAGTGISIILLILVAILFYNIKDTNPTNVITNGRVKISIEESENGEIIQPVSEVEYVEPGELIQRKTVITISDGSQPSSLKVWLITYGLNTRQQNEFIQQIILEEGWSWDQEAGCFTYEKTVCEGDQILFSQAVMVPETWTLLKQMPVFCFQVMAEATETGTELS